jgi:hypothetical protein
MLKERGDHYSKVCPVPKVKLVNRKCLLVKSGMSHGRKDSGLFQVQVNIDLKYLDFRITIL